MIRHTKTRKHNDTARRRGERRGSGRAQRGFTRRRNDATTRRGFLEFWLRGASGRSGLGWFGVLVFCTGAVGLSQRPGSTTDSEGILQKRVFSLRCCVDPTSRPSRPSLFSPSAPLLLPLCRRVVVSSLTMKKGPIRRPAPCHFTESDENSPAYS